jgi:mRNA-degrading endonuclease YafQ of YafQ-DinJ toxin-antitoxin module
MQIRSIRFTSHFLRALKKLPVELKPEVRKREQWFRLNCFDPRLKTHPLSGRLEGCWSFSITRKHRIMFSFARKDIVDFIDIGDHDIYR